MAMSLRTDALKPADDALAAYAGFWQRLAAFVVDMVILTLAIFAVSLIVVITLGGEPALWSVEYAVYLLLNTAILWLYYAGQESGVRQATFGKRLMRLRVTDLDGEAISFARASVRHFAKLASAIPFMAGFLAVAFTPRKQGLHDMIAGRLVKRADGGS